MNHSPEPWRWANGLSGCGIVDETCDENTGYERRGGLVDDDGKVVCWFGNGEDFDQTAGSEPSEADIQRILACIEFCAGIPTETLIRCCAHGVRSGYTSSHDSVELEFTNLPPATAKVSA